MSTSTTRSSPQPLPHGDGSVQPFTNTGKHILSCWKEIADYLGKGVRTVQRWERECGLPVRRIDGTLKGRVVAFTAELDEWLRRLPTRWNETVPSGALGEPVSTNVVAASHPLDQPDFRPLVLSVDDDRNVLFVREHLLKSEGYNVVSAAHGKEALAIFKSQSVGLVLLDFQMPGLDGGVVGRRMKAEKPNVPIIIVSGNTLPEDVHKYAEAVVVKGEHPSVLLSTINTVLQEVARAHQAIQSCFRQKARSKSTA